MEKRIIEDKSFNFARRVVKLCKYLEKNQNEYTLSKQILRSGTAIGALVRKSRYAESKKDFIHKLQIALKEAYETEYWLLLIHDGDYISSLQFNSLIADVKEVLKMLISIIKSGKRNLSK